MHICWLVLFIWEARPSKDNLDLPLSFRSVRYLDVFGSLRRRQVLERQKATSLSRERRAAASENGELQEMEVAEHVSPDCTFHLIQDLLNVYAHSQSLLSEEEVRCLQLAKDAFLDRGMSLVEQGHEEGLWLQRILENDVGEPIACFVNTKTFDIVEADPPISQQLQFEELEAEIQKLLGEDYILAEVEESQEAGDDVRRFEIAGPLEGGPRSFGRTGFSVPISQHPLVPTLRRPGSSQKQSSLPWKYFLQISSTILCVWLITTLYCLCNVGRETRKKPTLLHGKNGPWPHDFFAPSALACDEKHLLLGDRFAVYRAAMTHQKGLSALSVHEDFFNTMDSNGLEWGVISIGSRSSQHRHLFLLQRGGRAVLEFNGTTFMTWPLSVGSEPIHAMSVMNADVAFRHCTCTPSARCKEGSSLSWAILAAAGHEILILCPHNGTLYPRRRIPAAELNRVAVHMTKQHLWSLTHGETALVREDLQSGLIDTFNLPKGRNWAPGLCLTNAGPLMVAYHGKQKTPEMWHFEVD